MSAPPICFYDLETRSTVDIKKHGAARYARDPSTEIICIAAAFRGGEHDGKHGVWAPAKFRAGNAVSRWLPDLWNDWIEAGGLVCGWNSNNFDQPVMYHLDQRDPHTHLAPPTLEQSLDAMAQAENYSLPGRLSLAGAALRVPVPKDKRGAALIRKLSNANLPWNPTQDDMCVFMEYALKDVLAMIGVWERCRPWSAEEWEDCQVVARENARGVLFDIDLAEAASLWGAEEGAALDARLQAATGDPDITLRHSVRKTAWLRAQLGGTDFEDAMMASRRRKKGIVRAHSSDKKVQHKLRQRLADTEDRDVLDPEVRERVLRFLAVLEEGNGVAAKKFIKVLDTHCDGFLHNQFRCSPTITGRHAARGVQFDNVIRAKLPRPADAPDDVDHVLEAADALIDGRDADTAARRRLAARLSKRFGIPFQQVLARLIRPGMLAPEGTTLVWGDWSSIEARVLPWLAKAEAALTPYRDGTCVYSQAAEAIYGTPWREIYAGYEAGDAEMKHRRSIGKVAVLAFGYQGGAGAFLQMANSYGLDGITEARANRYKEAWRESNPWAVRFWRRLDEAAWQAWENVGARVTVGRLTYLRVGGDLWCQLPDGRPIVYPAMKAEDLYKEAWDAVVPTLTYRKIWSGAAVRGELYGGVLCENATQGAAASLLRDLMRRLDRAGHALIGTTHDEVRLESTDPDADAAMLKREMETNPAWADGLPLKAEIEQGPYYGK